MRRRFDALGAIAGTGGLVLLVEAIAGAPQYGWGSDENDRAAGGICGAARRLRDDREPGAGAVVAAVDLSAAHARRREHRALLSSASFFGFVFVGTLYMQQVLHYSALEAGLAWLATSLTSIAFAGLSQMLVTRRGAKIVMTIGMALIATGVIWATQVPSTGTS